MQTVFGLIGYPLGHSFSKGYFSEKFEKLGISSQNRYELFSLKSIEEFPDLIKKLGENIGGFNVTIPYKQAIIPYLDELDLGAKEIGAVNTIKISRNENGEIKLIGFNTDYYGFKQSLENWEAFNEIKPQKALVLGHGGAAKAIIIVLNHLGIEVQIVTRSTEKNSINYNELTKKITDNHLLIVNTTPLGMYPNTETFPEIPYHLLSKNHLLYDLVYNPIETQFLKKGIENNVKSIHSGLDMLHGQAEKAWGIWSMTL